MVFFSPNFIEKKEVKQLWFVFAQKKNSFSLPSKFKLKRRRSVAFFPFELKELLCQQQSTYTPFNGTTPALFYHWSFFSLKRFENEILRRTYKNVVLILKLDNVDFKDYQDTQRNMIVKNYSIFEDLQNLLGQKLIFGPKNQILKRLFHALSKS